MNLKKQPCTLAIGQVLPVKMFTVTLSAIVTTAKDMLMLSNKLNTEEETIGEWDNFESKLFAEFPNIFIQIYTECDVVGNNVQFLCHVVLQKNGNREYVSNETSKAVISRIRKYFSETV
jgi:hypothetical protein